MAGEVLEVFVGDWDSLSNKQNRFLPILPLIDDCRSQGVIDDFQRDETYPFLAPKVLEEVGHAVQIACERVSTLLRLAEGCREFTP